MLDILPDHCFSSGDYRSAVSHFARCVLFWSIMALDLKKVNVIRVGVRSIMLLVDLCPFPPRVHDNYPFIPRYSGLCPYCSSLLDHARPGRIHNNIYESLLPAACTES